ncbi:protein FAR1-RELATED SEQUENCE 5-like [Daucus carota subsp. sativus]|uniref:protein FAR1-RELATED SEQUENCE 5-like n=1 Tax=Daucus carota subsp. sativus TaxID=79200 RepID=UPI003083CEB3
MYEKQHHWVKAYLKDTFFAGMKSSQRSESMNSFFDGYVNSNTPLSDFVDQYEKAIASRRDTEEKEDLISMTTTPDLTNMHSLEAHAGKVYSRNIFKLFQNEFMQILHCQLFAKIYTQAHVIISNIFVRSHRDW